MIFTPSSRPVATGAEPSKMPVVRVVTFAAPHVGVRPPLAHCSLWLALFSRNTQPDMIEVLGCRMLHLCGGLRAAAFRSYGS